MSVAGSASGLRWASLLAGIAYVIVLCGLGYASRHWGAGTGRPLPGWNPADPAWLVAWTGRFLARAGIELIRFVPVGLLSMLAVTRCGAWRRDHVRMVAALIMAVGLSAMVRGFDLGGVPPAWRLVLPIVGCLVGGWTGLAWVRGRRARLWLLPELGLPLILFGAAACWLWLRAVEIEPLKFAPTRVTSVDKRHLVDLVRRSRQRSSLSGDHAQLRLSGRDVNMLVAWWLHLGRADRKAKLWLADGTITGQATLGTSGLGGERRFVNLRGTAEVGVARGHLVLDIQQLHAGQVGVPRFILEVLSPMIAASVEDDPNIREMLSCVDSLRIGTDELAIVGNAETFRKHVLPFLLAKEAITPEVTVATHAQMRHLAAVAARLPRHDGNARFVAVLKAAFAAARTRSRTGDPVVENRGALLAVAIVSGEKRLERLIGPVPGWTMPQLARWRLRRVHLRGRVDWAKHFLVSGALTLLLDNRTIDAIGLFKEKLDAAGGGSGFSFADLMADRAGRLFARAATRDQQSARAMQTRLAGPVTVADLLPPTRGLPEGLTAAQLQSRYGGVGGRGYRKIEQEIDRRLRACPLLQAGTVPAPISPPSPAGVRGARSATSDPLRQKHHPPKLPMAPR